MKVSHDKARVVAHAGKVSVTFGAPHGMRLLDNSLAELVQAGIVSREQALRACEDPKLIP